MGYGKIMSNCGAGMQKLFNKASSGISRAKTSFMEAMREPSPKPYSKMTHEERLAFDLDSMEMDERALQKYHAKMVKRYGPNYHEQIERELDWW